MTDDPDPTAAARGLADVLTDLAAYARRGALDALALVASTDDGAVYRVVSAVSAAAAAEMLATLAALAAEADAETRGDRPS